MFVKPVISPRGEYPGFNMKLTSLLIVAGLLAFGWLTGRHMVATIGALLFIVTEVADIAQAYIYAKRLRQGLPLPDEKRRVADKLARWLNGLFFFVGLGAGLILGSVAGAIIFFGVLVSYFVQGVIGREVGGIPLRMGYGGWYVARRQGRRRQRRR